MKKKSLENLSVYERISYKANNSINKLSYDEREKLEDLLIEKFAREVRGMDDESLLNMAVDKGQVL